MIEAIVNLDVAITQFFANTAPPPILDKIMMFVTYLGEGGFIWILCGIILLIFKKTRIIGISLLLSLAFTFLLSQVVIKNIVNRPRPYLIVDGIKLLIAPPLGSSFPSSHSATAFASAMALFHFNKVYGAIALAFAAVVAFSRIYLCVHFLSDVVVGSILGVITGAVITHLSAIKTNTEVDTE